MTSAQPNLSLGGKSNTSPSYPPLQQQQSQTTSPGVETSSRRSSNHSTQILTSARNNQSSRRQHKNQRRPRLADEDVIAEPGAMRNANSRRGQTSITHLMNFTLPPRPQYSSSNRTSRRDATYGPGSGHHAVNKARYIHANYRFIVNPSGDYHKQAIDADVPIEWNDVLQILASAGSQASSCPICLSNPVAPRMAKCGHIFCLPCLIRYMHSTDDTNPILEKKARWKKCPICWDSVYMTDAKPVRWYTGQECPAPCEGDDVVLRLVKRQPGSTLALPRDGADALGKLEDIPWYFAAEVMDYARVMKGSEDYMAAQFDSEIEEIQQQEKEDEIIFGEETEWAKKAIRAVNDAKERVKGIGSPPTLPKQPIGRGLKRPLIEFNNSDREIPDMYLIQHATKSGQSLPQGVLTPISTESPTNGTGNSLQNIPGPTSLSLSVETLKVTQTPPKSARINANPIHHPDSPYFFYQALLHYYLAPLDIRILKSTFGNFASFPSTILPRVEHVSTGHIVDDDLRKRAKYLAHLPYGCEVGFLECNWTDIVRPEILEKFHGEIDRRRRKNLEKENREEKDRIRAEKEEEDKRWAAARRRRPSTPPGDYSSNHLQPSAPSSLDAAGTSPPWPSWQGSSFAPLASPSTSPAHPRTVWGTALIPSTTPKLPPQQSPELDGDDGWLHGWEKEPLTENDLIAHADATSLNVGNSSTAPTRPVISGKKKAKKITLMSTNARRAA